MQSEVAVTYVNDFQHSAASCVFVRVGVICSQTIVVDHQSAENPSAITRRLQKQTSLTLGRKTWAKISAVEGVMLSAEAEAAFAEFERLPVAGRAARTYHQRVGAD
jgi:hypothetical protein